MHYIRFLKLPRLLPGTPPTLTAKITVTTDLGESFLCVDIPLKAEVWLEEGTAPLLEKDFQWKGSNGIRALSLDVPLPAGHGMYSQTKTPPSTFQKHRIEDKSHTDTKF